MPCSKLPVWATLIGNLLSKQGYSGYISGDSENYISYFGLMYGPIDNSHVIDTPFSLFREYVAQLMEYGGKFLILGNMNALTYKEIFPLVKENKLWLGTDNGGTKWFQVPPHYDIKTETRVKIENGVKYFSMGSIMWFTNFDHKKRHKKIILFRQYIPDEYQKYDNYDAINVDKYIDIPADYNGVMGVPVTFLDKYNPDQFEIISNSGYYAPDSYSLIGAIYINGKKLFKRIAIKRKQ